MWTLLLLTLSVVVDGRCGDTRRRLSGGPVPTRVSALRIRGGSQDRGVADVGSSVFFFQQKIRDWTLLL